MSTGDIAFILQLFTWRAEKGFVLEIIFHFIIQKKLF